MAALTALRGRRPTWSVAWPCWPPTRSGRRWGYGGAT